MSNFLEYIKDDIELKTSALSSMPDRTKTNINNLVSKLETFESRYSGYKDSVKKYIDVKAGAISIKDGDALVDKQKRENLIKELNELQSLKVLINPLNTYYEKLGFDSLLYKLSRYADFDFSTMNNIIKEFISKFDLINVKLTKDNFLINTYVNEYMAAYFESSDNSFSNVESVFEKIYWVNPNLVGHIELNFRRLIRKNKDKFEEYASKIRDEAVNKTGVDSYDNYLKKLESLKLEIINLESESVTEMISYAKDGKISFDDYFDDSNLVKTAYSSLFIEQDNLDKIKVASELKKLKNIILEFKGYNEFIPFIEIAKAKFNEYKEDRPINEVGAEIEDLEDKLRDISEAIFGGKDMSKKGKFSFSNLFKESNEPQKSLKEMEADSIKYADRVLELYKLIDETKFYTKLKTSLNEYSSMNEFLNLFSSFNFYKYVLLREAFKIEKYDALIDMGNKFDEFCNNPNNVVITSIPVFSDYNIAKLIVNKYRLNNINLTEENLKTNGLDMLAKYIDVYLRIEHFKSIGLSADKLWFIVEASKLNKTN